MMTHAPLGLGSLAAGSMSQDVILTFRSREVKIQQDY